MYKGDDMTDWEPMGSIGPTRNYCPAYGYQVPYGACNVEAQQLGEGSFRRLR